MANEFDPFDFVPSYGPIQNKGGGVFTFKRAGRDLAAFSPLLQYGTVRAAGDTVTLRLTSSVKTVERKAQDNARKIRELNARFARNEAWLAKQAGKGFTVPGGNTKRFLANAKSTPFARVGDETARLGFVQLGRSGFTITGDSLRALGGKAFTAGIGINIVGGGLNQAANVRDGLRRALAEGASTSELAGIAGARAAGGFIRAFGALSGVETLTGGLLQLGGLSEEDAQSRIDRFYFAASHTREEIERRQAAQRRVVANALAQVQKTIEADVAKLNEYVPTTFRVRDRFDRERYRENIREANRLALDAKRDYGENEVRKQARMAVGD